MEVVIALFYLALAIFMMIMLLRFVRALEQIADNVELGVAAWTKSLGQPPTGSA